jgi:hypothetical protein
MQVGCGFRVKAIKGRDYVYFWSYEVRGGRSRQIYRYMGPKGSSATARRLADALEAYYASALDGLRRRWGRQRAAIVALQT